MIEYKKIYISKVAHYLPSRVIKNQDLIDLYSLKMKDSWIEKRVGIIERRWALPEQAASDLAAESIRALRGEESSLFVSTISQDYLTPSTSSEIKRKLNWKGSHIGVDISAACAGFLFGIEMAALRLLSGSIETCYVCATEVRSRFLDFTDRRTVFLFGDASVACLLTTDQSKSCGQLLWTANYTQSTGEPEILIRAGGSKFPIGQSELLANDHKIRMVDGGAIENVIFSQLETRVKENLQRRNETLRDYDFIVFHQGNAELIKKMASQMGFTEDQTHINFNIYGNSSSASVGVALSEAVQLKKIKPGCKVLLVAMGAGYHLGIAALRWDV